LLELCAGSGNALDGMARFSSGTLEMGSSVTGMIAGYPSRFNDLFFWSSSAPNGEKEAISTRGTEITKNQCFLEGFIRSGQTVFGCEPFREEQGAASHLTLIKLK
jgi:hypothetical protein